MIRRRLSHFPRRFYGSVGDSLSNVYLVVSEMYPPRKGALVKSETLRLTTSLVVSLLEDECSVYTEVKEENRDETVRREAFFRKLQETLDPRLMKMAAQAEGLSSDFYHAFLPVHTYGVREALLQNNDALQVLSSLEIVELVENDSELAERTLRSFRGLFYGLKPEAFNAVREKIHRIIRSFGTFQDPDLFEAFEILCDRVELRKRNGKRDGVKSSSTQVNVEELQKENQEFPTAQCRLEEPIRCGLVWAGSQEEARAKWDNPKGDTPLKLLTTNGVESLARNLPEEAQSDPIVRVLVHHASREVRESLASRRVLPVDVVRKLLFDFVRSVRAQAAENDAFLKALSVVERRNFLLNDPELLWDLCRTTDPESALGRFVWKLVNDYAPDSSFTDDLLALLRQNGFDREWKEKMTEKKAAEKELE